MKSSVRHNPYFARNVLYMGSGKFSNIIFFFYLKIDNCAVMPNVNSVKGYIIMSIANTFEAYRSGCCKVFSVG